MSDLQSIFSQRAKEEFGKEPEGSYFLNIDLISDCKTAVAVPTARKEASFDIDINGNLCSPWNLW